MPLTIPFGWNPYVGVSGEMGASDFTAANGGYFRFENLGTARALWDGTVDAGDKANALKPAPAGVVLTVTGQNVRLKLGADPTADEGLVLVKDTTYLFDGAVVRFGRLIETAATAEVAGYYLRSMPQGIR